MSEFIEFVHSPLDPPPPGRHPVDHMGEGHRRATTLCFEAGAYGSLLHPDMVYADGFVAALCRHVALGTQVLQAPAFRYAEEPLFAHLGLDADLSGDAPIALTSRKIVAAAVESLHDEIVECEFDGPRFSTLPNSAWWRHSSRGILARSFAWTPVLIDYASISRHELDGLRGPLTDGDYIARNFAEGSRIRFVSDSDEVTYATWTPAAVGARDGRKSILQNLPIAGRLFRHAILRRAYLYYTRDFYPYGDHVKAKGFKVPLLLHSGDLDESWAALENAAAEEIKRAVGDLFDPPIAPVTARTRLLDWMLPLVKVYAVLQQVRFALRFIGRRIVAAVRGDQAAQDWIYSRLRARLGF